MQNGLMPSARTAPGFFLDPRTKILLVMVCPTILIAGSEEGVRNWIRLGLALLPLFLFLMSGRFKTTIKLGLIYAAAYLLKLYLVPLTGGLTGFLMVALTGIFTRFIPGLAIGYYLVSTTTVSEFIASMERMHVPQSIVIPVAVMFRFFPTVAEEAKAIDDAMRMRGIGFTGFFKNPLAMLEYRLVPMMMSTVKIGEELSVAALTRGLGSPVKRTNLCQIRFGLPDAILSMMVLGAGLGFIFF